MKHANGGVKPGGPGESTQGRAHPVTGRRPLADVVDDAPTPDFAAMLAEPCESLLARLADPDLKALTQAKLEGYTNQEIAARLGYSVRTIERLLHRIRKRLEHAEPS